MPQQGYDLVQWGKFLFHITHEDNVPGILARGILSQNAAKKANLKYRSIAYEHIQARRGARRVPVGKGGTLHDYVPLFFGARPPMLYAVRYSVPQDQVFHLLIRWEVLDEATTVFTDGHADMDETNYFCKPANLAMVDQEAARARWWHTPADLRRKKAAEVLVWKQVPPEMIAYIAVMNDAAARRAQSMVRARGVNIPVLVAPEFFYV